MDQMYATRSLSIGEAFEKAIKNIFIYTGRARRSEFWWPMAIVYLINILLTPILGSIMSLLTIPLKIRRLHDTGRSGWWWGVGAILQVVVYSYFIYDLITSIIMNNPVGKRVVFLFVAKYLFVWSLILLYKLILFIFYCLDSQPTTNKYGPSPKYHVE